MTQRVREGRCRILPSGYERVPNEREVYAEEGEQMKLLTDDCPLCQGSGEVLNKKVRMIGYTLAEGEQLDEHLIPCPLCERIKAQAELTLKEVVGWIEKHDVNLKIHHNLSVGYIILESYNYQNLEQGRLE